MKTMQVGLVAALALTVVGVVGCSGEADRELTKAEAAQAISEGQDLGDVCSDMGWYGDGVCDAFCSSPDGDCPIACPAIAMEPDGVCSLPPDDPCQFIDPDCETVACPAIAMEPDGVCSLPPDDPCQFIDPDCETVACPAIWMEPDGVCSLPADDPCQFIDTDCQ